MPKGRDGRAKARAGSPVGPSPCFLINGEKRTSWGEPSEANAPQAWDKYDTLALTGGEDAQWKALGRNLLGYLRRHDHTHLQMAGAIGPGQAWAREGL